MYLKFSDAAAATKAKLKINGRMFAGRPVHFLHVTEDAYEAVP